MKTASGKFLVVAFGSIIYAIILFLIMMTLPLLAQTNAPAGIGAGELVAATNGVSVSNAVAVSATKPPKTSGESSSTRINNTGVRTNGENPMDTKMPHDSRTGLVAILAMLVPFAPFAMVVAIVAIVFYFNHHRNKMAHETMRVMVEKGVPITPELIAQFRNRSYGSLNRSGQIHQRYLLPGLILIGVGIALMINGHSFGGGGLIVLFIGIAFLIVWLVNRRDRNNGQSPKQ